MYGLVAAERALPVGAFGASPWWRLNAREKYSGSVEAGAERDLADRQVGETQQPRGLEHPRGR